MTTCTSRWQAAISLVAALGLSTLACSDTLTVCSSGCDYTDIQSAIDDASDGDVIEIAAGTYRTSSLGYLDTLGKAITLRGSVDATDAPTSVLDLMVWPWKDETSSTVFENFLCTQQWILEGCDATIRNCVFDDVARSGVSSEPALHVGGGTSGTVIDGCTFRRNNSLGWSDWPCALYVGSDNSLISDCVFENNKPSGKFQEGATVQLGGDDITVEGCTFRNNGNVNATAGGALGVHGSGVTVRDSTFIENYSSIGGGAIYTYQDLTIRRCVFQGNYVSDAFEGGAIMHRHSATLDIEDSLFCGNWYRGSETIGYSVVDHHPGSEQPGNHYSDSCQDCNGDGLPDGAAAPLGTILRVPSEYATIEDAIDAACFGEVIEVAAGTYAPSRTLDTRGLGLTLRGAVDGSGRPATIIDGRGMRGVISCIGESFGASPETRLENLMIVGGAHPEGGGLRSLESNVHLENCIFRGNQGRAIHSRRSTLTVSNCTFDDNPEGAVRLECGRNLFTGCEFEANAADQGAGVFCTGWVWVATAYYGADFYIVSDFELCHDDLGGTTFEACTFSSNGACVEGGGAYVDSCNPLFSNCSFTGASADGGGALVIENASPILEHCVFANNEAVGSGGALLVRGESLPIVRQCTFQNNRAGVDGGAVVLEESVGSDDAWMTFGECQFTFNRARRGGALANHGNAGGAIHSVSLEDCMIDENIAEFGGGLFTGTHAGTRVLASHLTKNRATMGLGGGIETGATGETFVGDTFFCGNLPWPEAGNSTYLGGNLYGLPEDCSEGSEGGSDGQQSGGSSENDHDAGGNGSDNDSADSGQDSNQGDLGGGGLPGRGGRGPRGGGGPGGHGGGGWLWRSNRGD